MTRLLIHGPTQARIKSIRRVKPTGNMAHAIFLWTRGIRCRRAGGDGARLVEVVVCVGQDRVITRGGDGGACFVLQAFAGFGAGTELAGLENIADRIAVCGCFAGVDARGLRDARLRVQRVDLQVGFDEAVALLRCARSRQVGFNSSACMVVEVEVVVCGTLEHV